MTDSDHALTAIARAAEELVPQLSERLARHQLGEIEVTLGDLHLRVAAGDGIVRAPVAQLAAPAAQPPPAPLGDPPPVSLGIASPAVGFFVYADGLGPGLEVAKGDALGHVEMLGVRHDVRAPRGGTIRHLVAETGEAVEYGQVVLEIDAAERAR